MGDSLNDDAYLLDFDHRLDDDVGLGLGEEDRQKKRKIRDDEDGDSSIGKGGGSSLIAEAGPDSVPPRPKKQKPPTTKKSKSGTYGQVLDWADPKVQHASLSAFLVRNLGELTDLELADILPGAEGFLNTSKNGSGVDSAIASHAPTGWKTLAKKQTAKGNNSPRILIITWGAMRTMDIIKKVKPFEVRVAKLFSKHFKVAEQRDMLQQNFHPIAVGTPSRLEKLLEIGALSLAHTDLVLMDMSQNQKKATILESNDVCKDLMNLLQRYLLPSTKKYAGKPRLCMVEHTC